MFNSFWGVEVVELAVIHLLGHSHIDAVWLWTRDETMRVCVETFSRVLDLMDRYPGLTFCQSTAQYYEWIERTRPDLFERVRAMVRAGRWEVVGGSWVEFDCNLPSGESLVRQMLYGKRYFREKLGVDVEVAWLPDSFGFCWTLPQILAKSGIKYFLTQKLRWNDTTVFPYNIFWWQAPDGSRVLAHQTLGSYSEGLERWDDVERQLLYLRLRHGAADLLILFGFGDHGGGVSQEHVERALSWIRTYTAGDVTVKFSTASEYFRALERHAVTAGAPLVNDELYLQFHRGTYTTQVEVKKWNRRLESLIENAEKLSVLGETIGLNYPRKELGEAWRTILFYHFHDAICGSSIKEVYEEAERDYSTVYQSLSSLVERAVGEVARRVDTSGEGWAVIVFNTQSWTRSDIVRLRIDGLGDESFRVLDHKGRAIASQIVEEDGSRFIIFAAKDVPPLGYVELRLVPSHQAGEGVTDLSVTESDGLVILDNEYLSATVDKRSGLLVDLFHKKSGWHATRGGPVAVHVFEDKPSPARKALDGGYEAIMFDAWELYIYDQPGGVASFRLDEPTSVEVLERGPVRAVVASRYRFSQEGRPDTEVTVRTALYSSIPILYLEIQLDWRARNRLAKLSIPARIKGEFVCYEIPYGYIYRRNPYSKNATTAERGKHEVPGQRWLDWSSEEEGVGLSVLNDGLYGFDATPEEVRVTLLRSPSYPPAWPATGVERWIMGGEPTDQGRHVSVVALYPHVGDWREAGTVKRAIELNNPLIARVEEPHTGPLPKTLSLMRLEGADLPVTVVKLAEDGDDIVVRLYEPHGREATAVIRPSLDFREAYEADLLENPTKPIPVVDGAFTVKLAPNEIKTLILKR